MKNKILKWISVFAIICTIIVLFFIHIDVYTIKADSKYVFCDIIDNEKSMEIENMHSVSLSMMKEHYLINDQGIFSIQSDFTTQGGAGMPDVLREDEVLIIKSDHYEVRRHLFLSKQLNLFATSDSNWLLRLSDWVLDYRETDKTVAIAVKVESMSYSKYLFQKIMVLIS